MPFYGAAILCGDDEGVRLVLGAPVYLVALVAYGVTPQAIREGYQPEQPVPYSHALHAGELGLDCRYCHFSVEQNDHANVPPTQVCMNCHARLDYGAQFFSGYPDSRASVHYIPALENAGTGPLYGRDLRDHRGDAPLTPLGFARLATTQPDFQSCMASHFISHVLGDRATSDDVHAIEAAVAQTQSFRASMKVALERYALRWREASRPAEPSALAVGEPPKATHGDCTTLLISILNG